MKMVLRDGVMKRRMRSVRIELPTGEKPEEEERWVGKNLGRGGGKGLLELGDVGLALGGDEAPPLALDVGVEGMEDNGVGRVRLGLEEAGAAAGLDEGGESLDLLAGLEGLLLKVAIYEKGEGFYREGTRE